ncbi:hypothetical protein F4556_003997 [Kitasatospora gansuensis]|uniref:Polyketide synthesis cyclase n=1 Tax=Kitasatospora gansuensis TaxID=258050 RepID=A0A7W7WI59_9ACTN|nr:TcmI family type II polyketide cyclase [Kitasatospora gansuensis]MBB4948462.1 hypothetical protein [Kitasatospora gansuensis]
MRTTVTLTRTAPESEQDITGAFARFDASPAPASLGTLRRQLFGYHDLLVHIQDFASEQPAVPGIELKADPDFGRLTEDLAPLLSAYEEGAELAPLDAMATRFYAWQGKPVAAGEVLHSTVIVNRMDPVVIPEVSRLFAELDATDFPHHMGTRRRQLFNLGGVYFHIQDFVLADGYALIDQAWKEADPRFIKICRELEPLVKVYDPATWRSTADQVGTRFYRWEASA